MSTHKNCFELVKEVRQELNEYDDALATGDDTTGAYRNFLIVGKINAAIRELFALIAKRRPGEFRKEAPITAADSVFTLPPDFGRVVLFRDNYDQSVYAIHQKERRLYGSGGSQRSYYQKGRALVLDVAGANLTYTLVYMPTPRDVHQGRAAGGGEGSITLDPKYSPRTADYYNDMIIENVTKDWASPIIAYTAARVATIAETAAAEDFYALVPEIPEWAHHLIAPRATIMLKLLPSAREKPTRQEIDSHRDALLTTLREYAAPDDDQEYEDMFLDTMPRGGGIFL